MIADIIEKQNWSLVELAAIESEIYSNPDVGREIGYAGAVTPLVFTKAREAIRGDVKAKGGSCVRCGKPRVMTVSGRSYCEAHADGAFSSI